MSSAVTDKDVVTSAPARRLPVPRSWFWPMATLGVITVRSDYEHGRCLDLFARNHGRGLAELDASLTDENFREPTMKLVPDMQFDAAVFGIRNLATVTGDEILDFLTDRNAFLVGAQGAAQVLEGVRHALPPSAWIHSFDRPERLYVDDAKRHRVPVIHVDDANRPSFRLNDYHQKKKFGGRPPRGDDAILVCTQLK